MPPHSLGPRLDYGVWVRVFLLVLDTFALCRTASPPLGLDLTPYAASLLSNHSSAIWLPLIPNPSSASLPSPSPRYGHSSLSTPTSLIITHGYLFSHTTHTPIWLSDTWAFSYPTLTWSLLHGPCEGGVGPIARFGAVVVELGGAMWLYGGDDGGHSTGTSSYTYTLLSDLWRLSLTPPHVWVEVPTAVSPSSLRFAGFVAPTLLPLPSLPHAQHTACLLPSDPPHLLVFGGMTPRPMNDTVDSAGGKDVAATNQLWVVALQESANSPSEWRELRCPSPPDIRFGHSMTSALSVPSPGVGFSVWVYGGFRRGHGNYGDLWRLHTPASPSPQSCTWTLLSSVSTSSSPPSSVGPYPRGYASLIATAAFLVLFAGSHCSPGCVCSHETWVWDLHSHQWSSPPLLSADIPQGRYKHTGVVRGVDEAGVVDVVAFGGESYQPQKYHADVWMLRYDHWRKPSQWLPWTSASPNTPLLLYALPFCAIMALAFVIHRRRRRRGAKVT